MGKMKSKLGITLRKIRKGKKISLSSIADSNLSKSQISRFERGESEISCIRLINILDKLHITLDEFIILHDNNSTKTGSFANLVQYIRKHYSSKNFASIIELLSNSSSFNLGPYEKTMVKSILYTTNKNFLPRTRSYYSLQIIFLKLKTGVTMKLSY